MYTYARVKQMMEQLIELGVEPEFEIYLNDNSYMIIGYANHYSFQRCGSEEDWSGEVDFRTLDELYHAQTVDGICLEKDWNDIEAMGLNGIDGEENYQLYVKYLEDKHKPFAEVRPDLVGEWDYEKNAPLTPENVEMCSDKKVWWRCSKGHRYRESPSRRYYFNDSCPICFGLHKKKK